MDFKISELVVGELTNMRKVHAKSTKSRKIRIVAGRRFRRFRLVNQLPLSIMAVHAQYRATAPLSININQRLQLSLFTGLRYRIINLNCQSFKRKLRGRSSLSFLT